MAHKQFSIFNFQFSSSRIVAFATDREAIHHIVLPLVLVVFLILAANPFGFRVGPFVNGALFGASVAMFVDFGFWLNRQQKKVKLAKLPRSRLSDEIVFFLTATVLMAGIIIQSLLNVLDVWLVLALAVLVCTKVWGHVWRENSYKS